jgi:hypothetical protein
VRELVHDMRGQPVEKMRVVDPDQDPALALLSDKGIDEVPNVGHGIGDRVADQCGEGAERQGARGFGADDPVRPLSARFCACEDFAGEPGLAHARGPHDHHAGALASTAERTPNRCKLIVTSGQRIPADHGATITLSICLGVDFSSY